LKRSDSYGGGDVGGVENVGYCCAWGGYCCW
jgi:hypothetical protein